MPNPAEEAKEFVALLMLKRQWTEDLAEGKRLAVERFPVANSAARLAFAWAHACQEGHRFVTDAATGLLPNRELASSCPEEAGEGVQSGD